MFEYSNRLPSFGLMVFSQKQLLLFGLGCSNDSRVGKGRPVSMGLTGVRSTLMFPTCGHCGTPRGTWCILQKNWETLIYLILHVNQEQAHQPKASTSHMYTMCSYFCEHTVKRREDCPNKNKQRLFIQSKRVSHHHLVVRTQRKAEGWESFLVEKRKGCWCGETVDRLNRSRRPISLVRGAQFGSLAGPKLDMRAKIREAVSYYSSLGYLGPLHGLLFGFLDSLLEIEVSLPGLVTADGRLASWAGGCRLWVIVPFLYMVDPLFVYIFSVSTHTLREHNHLN